MSLPPGVTAEHIVDGHREKTLALLWSLIFHFKVCISHILIHDVVGNIVMLITHAQIKTIGLPYFFGTS